MSLNARAKKETLAMICSSFFQYKAQSEAFYQKFTDELSGFPGVTNFLVDAADAFIYWESRVTNDQNGEWLDATDSYAQYLLSVKAIPSKAELRAQARATLQLAGYSFRKGDS